MSRKKFGSCLLTLLAAALVSASGAAIAGTQVLDLVDPASEGVTAPQLIPESKVTPSYPPVAYEARFDGSVTLTAVILEDGSVGEVVVVHSARPKLGFEQAAIEAIQQWRFEPAQKDGRAVASFTTARLNFRAPRYRMASMSPHGDLSLPPQFSGSIFVGDSGKAAGFEGGISTASHDDGDGRGELRKVHRPPSEGLYDRRTLVPPRENVTQPVAPGGR